ncbi:hypothetical protein [Methylocella sp.]|uniref:hypothetical protein n=1 Tax=Methylocella sp. TaxID=1978226 RepID=UPI0035B47284
MASDNEKRAIAWLRDENQIQRVTREERSGKKSVEENDVSGGLQALLGILRGNAPLTPDLRQALAFALDPQGSSLLQLKKRLRRRPGRPEKHDTTKGAVKAAIEEIYIPKLVAETKKSIRPRIRAAGVDQAREDIQAQAVKKVGEMEGMAKTKVTGLMRKNRLKLMKNNKK